MTRIGQVSLVGAGPGDPELITVRGLNRIRKAEVLAYDRLVHDDLVNASPSWAERYYVGKSSGGGYDQHSIEALMIEHARRGKRVVRLKGGDPFVFGRGGEELSSLTQAGIPVEIVPGLTSAIAVPGLAGIPVTHRDYASSVTILTAHEDPVKPGETIEWDRMAATNGTLIIMMGMGRLENVCQRLIAAGRPPDTPAAVIASGSLPDERSVYAPLIDLPGVAHQAALLAPAIIVIGDVVRFARITESIRETRAYSAPAAAIAGKDTAQLVTAGEAQGV